MDAILTSAVIQIVLLAVVMGLPVVIEALDFAAKKKALKSAGYNRMLSGFAYRKFFDLMVARCIKEGVELIVVNPAYTSIIGELKFGLGLGLSRHQAAAYALGRRGLGFSERTRCLAHRHAVALPVDRAAHIRGVWSKAGKELSRRRQARAKDLWLAERAKRRAIEESRGPGIRPGSRVRRSLRGHCGRSPTRQPEAALGAASPGGPEGNTLLF